MAPTHRIAAADDGAPAGRPRGLHRLAPLGVLVGAAGFAAGVTCAYLAVRDLMLQAGGACASGGPYAIAAGRECGGEVQLLFAGVVGALVLGVLFASSTAAFGGAAAGMDAAFLMWAAGFGALAVNFLTLGIDPPATVSGGGTWIGVGVVFALMALGGAVPLWWSLRELIARRGAPEGSLFDAPIVRANVGERRAP